MKMEIDVNRLTPGMVLDRDVLGKSGKPIVPKDTTLTDLHITFIKKFLIKKVSVSPLNMKTNNKQQKTVENVLELSKERQILTYRFDQSVQFYKEIFEQVKNNVTLEMYRIRDTWIPIFHDFVEQPLEEILQLLSRESKEERFYIKNIVMTFLAIALAKKLGYEKKDWLQIGFATLLSDLGIAQLED